jgi:hypothetical protein
MPILWFQVTATESSKVFVKEETEEDEEEIFPSFYPTISFDEDPLKRQVFFLFFFKAILYRNFVAYASHLMLMFLFIDLLIMINQNQGKHYPFLYITDW